MQGFTSFGDNTERLGTDHQDIYAIVHNNNDGGSMIYWLKSWAPGLHSQMQGDLR